MQLRNHICWTIVSTGLATLLLLHCPADATFQYTSDSIIGIDTTPQSLWYVGGNRNFVSVRVFDDKFIGMYIDKASVQAKVNKDGWPIITGIVYERAGNGYSPKRYGFMYGVDNANNPVAIGDEETKVRNAKQPLIVNTYAGWQTKGIARIAEMFYYMATGQKFFGKAPMSEIPRTAAYQKAKSVTDYDVDLVYWYTQDVYDRCDGK